MIALRAGAAPLERRLIGAVHGAAPHSLRPLRRQRVALVVEAKLWRARAVSAWLNWQMLLLLHYLI